MIYVARANRIDKDFVLSVALTPDNQWVLSGSKDRGVQFWDPRTGDTQLMLQGHKNSGMSRTLCVDSWRSTSIGFLPALAARG